MPSGVDLPLPATVPADRANSTGRHRSVGSSTSSQGQQVLHPQPSARPVELGRDRTRASAQLGCQRPGVLPGHLVGQQGLLLPLGETVRAPSRWPPAPRPEQASSGAVAGHVDDAVPVAAVASCSFHIEAIRCRAVTIAYGSSMLGSTRLAAASTLTSVSCTRSSAAASLRTLAKTMRRTMGSKAVTSGAAPELSGRAPSSSAPPMASTLRRKLRPCGRSP